MNATTLSPFLSSLWCSRDSFVFWVCMHRFFKRPTDFGPCHRSNWRRCFNEAACAVVQRRILAPSIRRRPRFIHFPISDFRCANSPLYRIVYFLAAITSHAFWRVKIVSFQGWPEDDVRKRSVSSVAVTERDTVVRQLTSSMSTSAMYRRSTYGSTNQYGSSSNLATGSSYTRRPRDSSITRGGNTRGKRMKIQEKTIAFEVSKEIKIRFLSVLEVHQIRNDLPFVRRAMNRWMKTYFGSVRETEIETISRKFECWKLETFSWSLKVLILIHRVMKSLIRYF